MAQRLLGFPRGHRLCLRRDFRKVIIGGKKVRRALMIVHGSPNGLTWCRLGISVSRTAGTAVERNRIKRRIREAFRMECSGKGGLDLVVRPTRECLTVPFPLLRAGLREQVALVAVSPESAGRSEA